MSDSSTGVAVGQGVRPVSGRPPGSGESRAHAPGLGRPGGSIACEHIPTVMILTGWPTGAFTVDYATADRTAALKARCSTTATTGARRR